MGTTDSTATTERVARNLEVVAGLREVADWLESNIDALTTVTYAAVNFRWPNDRTDARGVLSSLAACLGESATEHCYQDTVTIAGEFSGDVAVRAGAKVRELVDAPPSPTDYEPIIPEQQR